MSANWKRIGIAAAAAVTLALTSPLAALAAKGGDPGRPDNPGNSSSGGGGSGHTEVVGNNLSFPVIWGDTDGAGMALPGTELTADLTVPWIGNPIDTCPAGTYPFAQKVAGNVWQAENEVALSTVYVDEIDWGDSLESVAMKVGRPVRVELSLYKTGLTDTLTGYSMFMLANPSSKDEVQGVCAADNDLTDAVVTGDETTILSYPSTEATVYSPGGGLVIQKIDPDTVGAWNGSSWDDAGAAVSLVFSGELNVGGKVIYGLSQGGWKPTDPGIYRATFFLPMASEVQFDESTTIRVSEEEEVVITAEPDLGGGAAVVDPVNNLTYIDIAVVAGGGGGGKPAK